MRHLRKRETNRLDRALLASFLARTANRAMHACMFLLFFGLGDIMGEFIAPEMGVTKLATMLAVLTLGCGYVAFRTFQR